MKLLSLFLSIVSRETLVNYKIMFHVKHYPAKEAHMERYFGSYQKIEPSSKKEGALLLSADNIIGDSYEIIFDGDTAWVKNRFGARVGHFTIDFSRQLRVLNARGWKFTALLSLVAFTQEPEPGTYWAEMAVLCFEPQYESSITEFSKSISSMLAEGIRPEINLGEQAISKVIESNGTWKPDMRSRRPKNENGTVVMKRQRKMSESLIEKGRAGNIGCYIVSIAFIIVVIAVIIFAIKTLLF